MNLNGIAYIPKFHWHLGLPKVQLDSQLELVSERLGKELSRLLKFLQYRLGLRLDDHYLAIRGIIENG
jgi:hypothetical protein